MQSFKSRMGTALRRYSWSSTGDGAASDSSRPPSPAPSIGKSPSKRKKRISIGHMAGQALFGRPETPERPPSLSDSTRSLTKLGGRSGSSHAVDESPKPIVEVQSGSHPETPLVEPYTTVASIGETPFSPVTEEPEDVLPKENKPNEKEEVKPSETQAEQHEASPEQPEQPVSLSDPENNPENKEIKPELEHPVPEVSNTEVQTSKESPAGLRVDTPEASFELTSSAVLPETTTHEAEQSQSTQSGTESWDFTVNPLSQAVQAEGITPFLLPALPITQSSEKVVLDAPFDESKPLQGSFIAEPVTPEKKTSFVGTFGNNSQTQLHLADTFKTPGSMRDEPNPFEILQADFVASGWTEHSLPDSSYYYSKSAQLHLPLAEIIPPTTTLTFVCDLDLRNEAILRKVEQHVKETAGSHPLDEGDLWIHPTTLKDPSLVKLTNTIALKSQWVDHTRRIVSDSAQAILVNGTTESTHEQTDKEKLTRELIYWKYIERHPAHLALPANAKQDAIQGLTWSYADRLLHNEKSVPNAFTQEECQSLLDLVRSLETKAGSNRTVGTKVTASVLGRITQYRLDCLGKPALSDNKTPATVVRKATVLSFPFRRAMLGFLSAIVCWGVPYLFLDPATTDPFAGYRQANPFTGRDSNTVHYSPFEDPSLAAQRRANAMMYGAGVGLTAAILLGTTTTLLTLRPPADSPSRTAGIIALLCAGASLAASIISLARLSNAATAPSNGAFSNGGNYFSDFYPSRDGNDVVLHVRASFPSPKHFIPDPPPIPTPASSVSSVLEPSSTSLPSVHSNFLSRWFS